MKVKDLIDASPIRVFEESINGGLGQGNLGVLTSRHGVGKTACLVHLAVDMLLRNNNVVHVSFGTNVEHTMNWYKEVFREITDYKGLENSYEVYETLRTNRVMMNFSQENVGIDKTLNSLKTLIKEGAFKADAVFFDGYKLNENAVEDISKIKQFAKDMNVEVWLCVSPSKDNTEINRYGVPASLEGLVDGIDVLVGLHYNEEKSRVIMTVVKDHCKNIPHPTGVSLNPKTMLISE